MCREQYGRETSKSCEMLSAINKTQRESTRFKLCHSHTKNSNNATEGQTMFACDECQVWRRAGGDICWRDDITCHFVGGMPFCVWMTPPVRQDKTGFASKLLHTTLHSHMPLSQSHVTPKWTLGAVTSSHNSGIHFFILSPYVGSMDLVAWSHGHFGSHYY